MALEGDDELRSNTSNGELHRPPRALGGAIAVHGQRLLVILHQKVLVVVPPVVSLNYP